MLLPLVPQLHLARLLKLLLTIVAMTWTATATTTSDEKAEKKPSSPTCGSVDVGLTGVPETMLWTLHNRVSIASQRDGFLKDPKACEIYQSIDYDYERSFGTADSSHAIRSWLFDQHVLEFWKHHPNGTVVNLGEGLETQRFRVRDKVAPNVTGLMVTVDLPSAIEAREKFIQPDEHHLHIAASALDLDTWAKHVPQDKPVFITAQGLFMYLEQDSLKQLFQGMKKRFPSGTTILFDSIAKWLSNKITQGEGWKKTKHYTIPPTPFGVNRFDAPPLFKSWIPGGAVQVEEIAWPMDKMDNIVWRFLAPMINSTPVVRGYIPGMVFRVTFTES